MSTVDQPQQSLEVLGHSDESFFGAYHQQINELLTTLQLPPVGSLGEAVVATQPWARGDHFSPETKTMLEGDAAEHAKRLYEQMGLVNEVALPQGVYDQIIVLGGMQRANHIRLGFLDEAMSHGVTLADEGKISLWGGQRDIDVALEASLIQEGIAAASKTPSGWLHAIGEGRAQVATETESLRLAALQELGSLGLKKMHLRFHVKDPVDRYEFESGKQKVQLLNTMAVDRPQGEPRHTTEACAKQWLAVNDIREGARVAFVSSNPYLRRTARVVQSVFAEQGRGDIQLIAAGPAAYEDAKDYLFMGEVARNLYEDNRSI